MLPDDGERLAPVFSALHVSLTVHSHILIVLDN